MRGTVATLLMGPLLGRFLEQYPDITLDLSVVRMPTDIVAAGFDAGIRFGEQVDRDMIAMRVMNEARFVVVGSPKYFARYPAPKTPKDLQSHNCIRSMLPNGTVFGWEFQKKIAASTPRSMENLSSTTLTFRFKPYWTELV